MIPFHISINSYVTISNFCERRKTQQNNICFPRAAASDSFLSAATIVAHQRASATVSATLLFAHCEFVSEIASKRSALSLVKSAI